MLHDHEEFDRVVMSKMRLLVWHLDKTGPNEDFTGSSKDILRKVQQGLQVRLASKQRSDRFIRIGEKPGSASQRTEGWSGLRDGLRQPRMNRHLRRSKNLTMTLKHVGVNDQKIVSAGL